MIYGNKLVIMCVFFTVATILDVLFCTVLNIETATSHYHLITRLVLCVIGVAPLSLFKHLEKLSLWALYPIHYALCCLLSLGYVYIESFYVQLHPNAYRDIFRSVTLVYFLFAATSLGMGLTRTARANRELKKIQNLNS